MSTIDLYQVLKEIPNVTDDQAKNAADSASQSDLAERVASVETKVNITLGLQAAILLILLKDLL